MTKKIILLCTYLIARTVACSQTVVKKIRPSDTDPLITTFVNEEVKFSS